MEGVLNSKFLLVVQNSADASEIDREVLQRLQKKYGEKRPRVAPSLVSQTQPTIKPAPRFAALPKQESEGKENTESRAFWEAKCKALEVQIHEVEGSRKCIKEMVIAA
jgi:hypothetical protein